MQNTSTPSVNPEYHQVNRIQGIRNQIDQTVDQMRENIELAEQRKYRLDSLEDKTDDLERGARSFDNTATKIQSKTWWKALKWRIAMIALITVILIIVILIILNQTGILHIITTAANSPAPAPAPAIASASPSSP